MGGGSFVTLPFAFYDFKRIHGANFIIGKYGVSYKVNQVFLLYRMDISSTKSK
jgi:hypothetical protein